MKTKEIKKRLEEIRQELRKECISYGELIELQSLADYIDPDDVELLEAAGIPENQDNFKTDVIFRIEKNGQFKDDILAVFPYEVADYKGSVMAYVHIGQHTSADYNYVLQKTKPAKEIEYSDLYRELTSIGYNLNVIKKRNYTKYLNSLNKVR